MRLGLYWSYATRSLTRGGQRTLLAIFCIAVGVMAIVALQLVGLSINQALTSNVREANGGDISVSASDFGPFQQSDLATFDQLKQSGQITDYAATNTLGGNIILADGSQVSFNLIAIPSNFPLVGDATFVSPSNGHISNIVQGNTVAVFNNVLSDLHGHIGSTYQVKVQDGRLIPITVGAEIKSGGAFTSDEIVISAATLNSTTRPDGSLVSTSYSNVYVIAPAANINSVDAALKNDFPTATVTTVADQLKTQQTNVKNIRLLLQIVGLLALFIGGIGIVNTMQVLLRRRNVEIAMLKTAGYRQSDLYGLFGLEAALLGLMGGAVGTGAGIGVSYIVRGIVGQAINFDLPVVLDTYTIVSGLLIGFFTAVIFGLLPIIQASQVRPLSVLRGSEETKSGSVLLTGGLLVLLSVLFVGLATSIIGDFVTAVLVVYGGTGMLFALALGFGILVSSIARLPVYDRPSPRILLWILLAFGILIGGGVAGGLSIAIGTIANVIAQNAGNGSLGTYLTAVFAGLGIVLIGGGMVYFLATILDTLVMFAPRSWKTAVMLAFRNMGRQRIRTTTTLTALFVGVFAIGLVVVLGQGIENAINSFIVTAFPRNVFVIATPVQDPQISAALPALPGVNNSESILSNQVVAQMTPLQINGQSLNSVVAGDSFNGFRNSNTIGKQGILLTTSNFQGFNLNGGSAALPDLGSSDISAGRNLNASDAGTTNVLVSNWLQFAPLNLQVGATLSVQSADGSVTKTLNIVGFYNSESTKASAFFAEIEGDNSLAQQLGGATTLQVYSLKVDPARVNDFRRALNQIAPSATVESLGDVTALISGVLNNLILMVTGIASLALIAGLIIIANAVALAMLERRREIGILKSVGHTSGSVLATVILENGLVGALGSLVAMAIVGTVVFAIQKLSGLSLGLSFGTTALIIGSTAILTMVIAAVVSWSATRVRPLEVLRYE